MSKARDLADSAQEINILDGKSFLDEDNLASDSATGIASQQSIKAYVDGITTTNITSTGALNSGSITSGFGNIDNGSSTITTTGAISGGSFVIGSADINENDLESIDDITAGTVSASKAVVVNTNKDITGFRNITATGTISGSLSGTLSGAIASTTTATTQAESDDSTKVATTEYVSNKITTLIGGAPSTLNDLNELAAAINDDANYNSTLTTALATKLPLAGGTMTGDVLYNDNIKAKFGAGSDLEIYHDGNHSYVKDVGTGNLKIQGEHVTIENTSGDLALYYVNTGVNLYHNNSAKLATTSTGIDVTGIAVVDGLTSTGLTTVNIGAETSPLRVASTGNDAAVSYSNASTPTAYNVRAGMSDTDDFSIWTSDTKRLTVKDNGNVGIGETSPLGKLHIKGSDTGATASAQGNSLVLEDSENGLSILSSSAGAGYINFGDSGDNNIGMIVYDHSANALKTHVNGSERMRIDSSGVVRIGGQTGTLKLGNDATYFADIEWEYNNNELAFSTSSGANFTFNSNGDERMRITSSGNFGVGTSSPQEMIHAMSGSTSAAIRASGEGNYNKKAEIGYHASDGPYIKGGSSGITSLKFYVDNTSLALTLANNRNATFAQSVTATTFHGDGSSLTGVGSTTFAAVGTYAFASIIDQGATTAGTTRSGTNGDPSNAYGTEAGTYGMAGTWRCMGYSGSTSGASGSTLWCRIS